MWASVEDSILLLGPPRSGKGLHVVINAILDAPGAVITTATRPDNIAATLTARQERGPVAVFDPQRLAEGLPAGLRWSPVRGCEDPLTAMIRATGLASATGLSTGGVESGGFWEGKTRTALQALLHAAALDNRTPRELFGWTLSPSAAADAVAILSSNPNAAPGWADSLESMIHADPRTRDSIWMGVSLALSCLADPRVLDAVSPGPGEEFDPVDFLTDNGTLYLLATGAGAGASWSLVAAFIEDLVETARRLAAASPGARLDPPLLLALDEIGNLSPLPSLPVLMAEGGGTGITTMPVLQSLSQARDKWGDHAAGAIWDASIVKVILGGTSVRPRPPGPLRPHRRTRRTHRHHLRRRLRLPVAATLHPPRAGHAARDDPHPALRHRPRPAPQRPTTRHRPAPLDRPQGRRAAPRRARPRSRRHSVVADVRSPRLGLLAGDVPSSRGGP